MHELAKSMISLSLSMGLLATKEATKLWSIDGSKETMHKTQNFLDNVSGIAADTLGSRMKKVFEYTDEFQRRSLDAGFTLMFSNPLDPSPLMKMGTDAWERSLQVFTSGSASPPNNP